MQCREDAPRSRRLASPRGGRRPKRISKPSVSAFFTGPEELKDTAHSAALLAQLKSFYDARLLCDVTIEVVTPGSGPGTGRLFPCNRNVLAAACPYFKSMFTGGMYESQQANVTMHDVDAESFEVLVEYCYTGRVSLSEANVQRLYAASDMLQLEYVREACASFLAKENHHFLGTHTQPLGRIFCCGYDRAAAALRLWHQRLAQQVTIPHLQGPFNKVQTVLLHSGVGQQPFQVILIFVAEVCPADALEDFGSTRPPLLGSRLQPLHGHVTHCLLMLYVETVQAQHGQQLGQGQICQSFLPNGAHLAELLEVVGYEGLSL